jgi:hypothetical protein
MLDGGNINREMYVDFADERLKTWKPGNNITYCPDEDKMINTNFQSVVTLISEFNASCNTRSLSDDIDRALQGAWEAVSRPSGDPGLLLVHAKSQLGFYYLVCTDHESAFWKDWDFARFLYTAESLVRINMAIEDPANANTYKARAAKYKGWSDALYAAESKKSWAERLWQRFFGSR